ncbi:non-ribosomal peptide synthetase [Puia dinghuensis]|uniref:Carrier domain-containing protein n=1 Tax=Puia dinghuensis TaxID=1792502 RepID=A0A8J2ULN5_9BACT|nr:non-ribosomal peptide synthetase [Puia dinghuensis]GGB26258.1 hypothetical protein GCM10011511_57760 [Puia dinghuensis]
MPDYPLSSIIDLLARSKDNGIKISCNGENLVVGVQNKREVDPAILDEIRKNKEGLKQYFKAYSESPGGTFSLAPIEPAERTADFEIPLSFAQGRLWLVDRMEGSLSYHLPMVLSLTGKLNEQAIQYAMNEVVNRHEVLRTVYGWRQGEACQWVLDRDAWKLDIIECAAHPEMDIGRVITSPFDLSKHHMMRATLYKSGEERYVLVVVLHHIASDAWSSAILVEEVVELYNSYCEGRVPRLSPLPIQYADYAIWQRRHFDGAVFDKKLDYWRQKLTDLTPIDLPTDRPRSAEQSPAGGIVSLSIPKDLIEKLMRLSREHDMTLYMVLLSTLKVLLYRYSNEKDICVLSSIAGRQQQEIERLIGFFANTLILRDEINGSVRVRELFGQIRRTTLDAYENQEVPFEKAIELSGMKREAHEHPISQVMFVLENVPDVKAPSLNGIRLQPKETGIVLCKFDLTLHASQSGKGLQLSLIYRKDLYKADTVARMMQHYENLLAEIVLDADRPINELVMLEQSELRLITGRYGTSTVNYPAEKTVVDLFLEQVSRTPDATALVFENNSISYSQLYTRARQVGSYLRKRGITEDMLVPVCMDRSIEMIIGIIGVLLAGGAYVPIDPDLPAARIGQLLDDVGAKVVLNMETFNRIGEGYVEFERRLSPNHLLYMIYTSGSSGKPKGVMIEHKNVVDYIYGLDQKVRIGNNKSFALVSTISADLGNTVIFGSLLSGGELHILSKSTVSDPAAIYDYFQKHRIDCLKIVPSHWKSLCADGRLLLPGKMLVFGGEPLHTDIIELIKSSNAGCTIVNHYGPTETTIGKLLYVMNGEEQYPGLIPIGKPFSNSAVYILSADKTVCPIGVPGELYIGGCGLARGYWRQEGLTAEKFVIDPFGAGDHTRLYRTGDLVRWRPDGNIEYCGRIDNQVKINGYRIEPEEIEQVIDEHPLVKQCAVVAKAGKEGIIRLVAYVVLNGGDSEAILEKLKTRLPAYMVPSIVLVPERLPLTSNGKVDRKRLSELDGADLQRDRYTAPRNGMEETLVKIMQQLLDAGPIGIQDNFFELGGHSLLAIRFVSAIRSELSVEVSIGDIFDYPTAESLGEKIKGLSAQKMMPGIIRHDRPERIPLSYSQKRLWFIDQLEGSVQYHIPIVLRVSGSLNEPALSYAFTQVIERHEVLRTVIEMHEGEPVQRVLAGDTWRWRVVDNFSNEADREPLALFIRELVETPFDLSRDYKLRAALVRLCRGEYILAVVLHHIASDGWSTPILIGEIAELYNSFIEQRVQRLKPLPIQYADYAIWQREYLKEEALEQKLGYWKQKLLGLQVLDLPTNHVRPTIQSNRGDIHGFQIDRELTDKLMELSQDQGATLFMTMLAVFKALLYRYSGQGDISIGVPVANRTRQEVEGLIGFFINTLVLRSQLGDDPGFVELLQRVKRTTLEAYEHQEVPFEKVVEAVVTERDLSRSPLFTVMFVLQNMPQASKIRLGDVVFRREVVEHTTSKFDLSVTIMENKEGLGVVIEYCSDLFEKETICRFGTHYVQLLRSVAEQPDQKVSRLEMLSRTEQQQLLEEFNAMEVDYLMDRTVVDLIEEQAERSPAAIAVVYGLERVNYRELEERSNQLGHYLRELGVREEALVPVCLERSVEMIVGILGILKAGGAYVPLDPEYPASRLAYMLEETEAKVVVSSREVATKLPVGEPVRVVLLDEERAEIDRCPVERVERSLGPEHLAYVIYTSGSTGLAKGVMIEHRGLFNRLQWGQDYFKLGPQDAVLQKTTYCFDVSVWELLWPLLSGARLVFAEPQGHKDPGYLKAVIEEQGITTIHFVPGMLEVFLREVKAGECAGLRRVLCSGEALKSGQVRLCQERLPQVEVYNLYGPTEASIEVSCWNCPAEVPEVIPIGRPVANTQLYIAGPQQQLCPIGAIGEIFIGGVQLSRGYLGHPEWTEERFVPDVMSGRSGERLYRTGDLGRWLPDGNIEFLGRQDEQVKISGYRIELGEIENVLSQSPEVSACAVTVNEDDPGNKRLAAYIVPRGRWDKKVLIDYLRSRLPKYMIPSLWVNLPSIPLTTNGKVDKKALASLGIDEPAVSGSTVAVNAMEAKILAIWQEMLGTKNIDIGEDFFYQGGSSLLLLKLAQRLSTELNRDIQPRLIFEYPTIRGFTQYIEMIQEAEVKNET